MSSRIKIINDPVYGFIDIPEGIFLSIIDHPYFQRLRRIKQGGFSNLVYPGAVHTRFHHALGAYHLAGKTVALLRKKGTTISAKEAEALQLALLLHDIGHGPYSHSLEHQLINVTHEDLTVAFMHELNREFDGALDLTIDMFLDKYDRPFFHQLISSQLDLDRLDYLTRDSFFTGVAEGVIGYDRLIYMMCVQDDQIYVEEKGLISVEKFILSRKMMYDQVYQHKMVMASELTMRRFVTELYANMSIGDIKSSSPLSTFIHTYKKTATISKKSLDDFSKLDDSDMLMCIKENARSGAGMLKILAESLLNRRLPKLIWYDDEKESDFLTEFRQKLDKGVILWHERGVVQKMAYNVEHEEIMILQKNGKLARYSDVQGSSLPKSIKKHYLCYALK